MFNVRRSTPATLPPSLALLLCILAFTPSFALAESVQARLVIPPAEVRVIGDDIPLLWEFNNTGSSPLAFLWEGCCRLNGRLVVTRDETSLDPIPPGSSLAHQFAKAERLEPSQPSQFPTRLDDWVRLDASGRYTLQGHYTGVLPSQQPMLPKSVDLWRGSATTSPLKIDLLSPEDYLRQRQERSQKRSWHLTLTGPDRLPPIEDASFRITFHNTSDHAVSIPWPGPVQLWFLNESGRRVGIHAVNTPGETVSLPPQSSAQRTLTLNADDLLDSPLGNYRLFLDVQDPDRTRCPSNPHTFAWKLSHTDVLNLVNTAAQGPRSGLRNKPLKRLRVHLAEIAPVLRGLANTEPPAPNHMPLLLQLQIAACLKPLAPEPGLVDVPWIMFPDGTSSIASSAIVGCLPLSNIRHPPPIEILLQVRRHLGWSLQPRILPKPKTSIQNLFNGLQAILPFQSQFATPIRAELRHPENGALTNFVSFQTNLIPANVVLRIEPGIAAPTIRVLRQFPQPDSARRRTLFTPAQIQSASFHALADGPALEQWLSNPPVEHPRVLVWAHPDLRWSDLARVLAPLSHRGWPCDLVPWVSP